MLVRSAITLRFLSTLMDTVKQSLTIVRSASERELWPSS